MASFGFPSLTFRTDSLLVKCSIASAIYYLPQDIAALTLLAWRERKNNQKISGSKRVENLEETKKKFLEMKGLKNENVITLESRKTWNLELKKKNNFN